jgi:hypothetical protein
MNRALAFDPESQDILTRDWIQVTCAKCEGNSFFVKDTFHLKDGSVTEEEVRCEDCTDGKVWQEIWV